MSNYNIYPNEPVGVEITQKEFNAYVNVQMSGAYNMFDPNARIAAGRTKHQFMAIMENYDELEEKYGCEEYEEYEEVEVDCEECYGTGYWEPYLEEGDRTEG